MSLSSIFNVAGSGMSAQTVRLNVTASNLANSESISSSEGTTYKARHPVFAAEMMNAQQSLFGAADSMGVSVKGIVEDQTPLSPEYDPRHPLANEDGYIYRSNVKYMEEMANMISASKAYQLNVEMVKSTEKLTEKTLSIGQGNQ